MPITEILEQNALKYGDDIALVEINWRHGAVFRGGGDGLSP